VFQALSTNIIGQRWFTVTNALAYYTVIKIYALKKYYSTWPWVIMIITSSLMNGSRLEFTKLLKMS